MLAKATYLSLVMVLIFSNCGDLGTAAGEPFIVIITIPIDESAEVPIPNVVIRIDTGVYSLAWNQCANIRMKQHPVRSQTSIHS